MLLPQKVIFANRSTKVLFGEEGVLDAVIGGIAGFALFYLAALVGERLLMKEAMGGGDIKLAAMLGLFVGWYPLLLSVFLPALLALLYAITKRIATGSSLRNELPFGPFLAMSAFITYLFGPGLQSLLNSP